MFRKCSLTDVGESAQNEGEYANFRCFALKIGYHSNVPWAIAKRKSDWSYPPICVGWWRGTVVERRSLAGELSLYCARPAADGWPLMWANRPLQVSQLGQLSISSFRLSRSINWVVSCNRVFSSSHGWRRLVNVWCVDWSGDVFASYITRVQLYVNACNGWPQFALQHHWLLPINCHFRDSKARWSGHHISSAI